jgi:hypothetical protein
MGMFSLVREKMAKARQDRNMKIQVSAEMKARSLEDKAKFAKALNKRLMRQEEAKKAINEVRETKRRIRTEKLKKFGEGLKSLKKLTKPNQSKNIVSLGSGKINPAFDVRVKK